MRFLGNLLWLILGGLLLCVTIVGVPWGLQHFKMAFGSIFPFGKEIR